MENRKEIKKEELLKILGEKTESNLDKTLSLLSSSEFKSFADEQSLTMIDFNQAISGFMVQTLPGKIDEACGNDDISKSLADHANKVSSLFNKMITESLETGIDIVALGLMVNQFSSDLLLQLQVQNDYIIEEKKYEEGYYE